MIGLLWYFSTIVAAYVYLLGSRLGSLMTPTEAVFAAIPVGTIGGAWVVYFVASLISNLGHQTMIVSNLVILWVVVEHARPFWRTWRTLLARGLGADAVDFRWTFGLVGVMALAFWPLYSSRMIPQEGGKVYSGGSCWADLPIHMHIAESFLQGRNTDISFMDMTSPVFAGEKMYYPFLPDFHSAVIKTLGGSLRDSFLWTGFLMSCSLFAFIFLLASRVTRSRLGGVLAVALVIFAGGMGGVNIYRRDGWAGVMNTDTAQNDVSGDGKVFWFQFVAHVLLPQRGANFAYPMAMLCLLLVWRAMDMTTVMAIADRRSLLVHAAMFASSLPLVQAHAFIAVGVIIGVLFVLDAHKWLADHRLLLAWAAAGATAAALGGPQLALFSKHVAKGSGGQFTHTGWIYLNHDLGRERGFFYFWWMALGPALPVFLLAMAVYAADAVQALLLAVSLRKADGSRGVERYLYGAGPVPVATPVEDAPARAGASSAGAAAVADGGSDSSVSPTAGAKPINPYTGSPVEAPEDNLASVTYGYMVQVLGRRFDDLAQNRISLGWDGLDSVLAPLNALSLNSRALDTVKLGAGAFAVFLLGNYVNFQPWDRDNCKLLNVWLMVGSALSGSLLAAPFEALLRLAPGTSRVSNLTGTSLRTLRDAPRAVSASRGVSLVLAAASGVALLLSCATGFFMISREFRQYHVLLDEEQFATAAFISENLAPKAMFLHKDVHITPSGTLAGRTALVSYNGWMWSHGYNYGDRDRDRQYALSNVLKDSDPEAYNAMRRWGVRYVLCEWCTKHARPREREPGFDADLYLDGQVKRIFSRGRYDVLELLGYGFPPS